MDIKVDKNTVVVFDLDDTLYNELDFLISAFKSIAKHLDKQNHKLLFSEMLSLYKKGKDIFGFLESRYSIKKKLLLQMYRNHKPIIKLDPQVIKLLSDIKNRQGKLAILTDGRSVTQRNKIESLGVGSYFDFISISEEIGATKPSLKGFKLIEEHFNKERYFYIADNLMKDFVAPNKLNWNSICLLDKGKNIHNHEVGELTQIMKPSFFIYDMSEFKII